MDKIVVDFAVIGSGPAGQKAAIQAAKLGKSVVIIEKEHFPGGSCLNLGTIPSKSLREAIIDLTRYHERGFYTTSLLKKITIQDLNERLQVVLEGERKILFRQFRRNNILFLQGTACFKTQHQIDVFDENTNLLYLVEAAYILIATGSKPRNPLHVPFDDFTILDSTRLLSINAIPKTMLVLGGGVIGAEYASFFAALGCKVTVFDKKERLLPELDAEIGMHLQEGLKEIGMHFRGNKIPQTIQKNARGAVVHFQDGSVFEADVLLYALGREADVEDLSIEKVGLKLNERGYLAVNSYFQTGLPHVYAAGDIIGYPALASTSMEQGRLCACHAFGQETTPFPTFFPLGIYTIPEISFCGYREEELQSQGIPYEVGRAYYYEIARSHITGSAHLGLIKIIFHLGSKEILGIHIVGRNATEVVHIGQVAMSFRAKIDYFVNQVFNYPTFAEGYRIAALNGLNKVLRSK